MSMLAEGLSSLKNERTDKARETSARFGTGGRLHGLLQKHMKKRTFHAMGGRGGDRDNAGATDDGGGHPNDHVHHGPSPNNHGEDHRTHKGYIDAVIRGLLYDEHRGGEDLLTDILHDIETNIHPRNWSLCRAPRAEPRDDGEDGPWDLDAIKEMHPHATRRVAMSIIRSGVSGNTFDKLKFDSRSISHTNLIASFKYRIGTITVGVLHCVLGLVEQSYYFDPWAQSFYQPPIVTLPIEVFLIALYVADVVLRVLAARDPLDHKWLVLKAILCVLFIIDWGIAWANIRECNVGYFAGRTIVSATLPAQLPMAAWFRAFRPLRPLMVLEAVPSLRKEVLSIWHCLRALVPVLFLVAIWILVFAIIGMYAFPRKVTAALATANPTEGDIYFTDIYVSIMTFTQIHFGSVIWPDVTMPAMIETHAGLYMIFLVFAVMSVVVVTNLLTAVVFQSYNEHAEKQALDSYMQAHVACAVGFRLLSAPSDDGDVITIGHFIALMRELRPQWNPVNFVMRAGQLVSSATPLGQSKKKKGQKKEPKNRMQRKESVRRASSIDKSSDIFDAMDSAFEMAFMNQNPNLKEAKERLSAQLNHDQVFLVIWRELKKIGHDFTETVPGQGVDSDGSDDCDGGDDEASADKGQEAKGGDDEASADKGQEAKVEANAEAAEEEAEARQHAGGEKHVAETRHKLQAEHMTCQQFMHLPEWLDIEIRKEQKLQVGGEASCCMRCRYGGPLITRRLRDIVSSPAYFWFFTIVICSVVATIFLDQVAATRSLGSNTRTLFDGSLLTLMLIDSLCKLLSVGVEPFVTDFWFLFEGFASLASFVVFFVILIKEGGSLDGNNDFSSIQQHNKTSLNAGTIEWTMETVNSTGTASDGVPTASFDALYNTGRILNLIRILPLFRVLNQNASMRIILKSIYQSIAYIMHLLFIVVCIWYMWGGLGVEIFGGILRQSEVMDDPQSSYGTAGYVRSPHASGVVRLV